MLPIEILASRQPGGALIALQEQEEECRHHGIHQLRRIGLFFLTLAGNLEQQLPDLAVIPGLEVQIGIALLAAERTAEEAGHQVFCRDLVPEYMFKGAAAEHVIDQHAIVLIAGAGVDHARRNDHRGAGTQHDRLILKIDGAIAGKDVIQFKIVVFVPMGRHIAQHPAHGDKAVGEDIAGLFLLFIARGERCNGLLIVGIGEDPFSQLRHLPGGKVGEFCIGEGIRGVVCKAPDHPADIVRQFGWLQNLFGKLRPLQKAALEQRFQFGHRIKIRECLRHGYHLFQMS